MSSLSTLIGGVSVSAPPFSVRSVHGGIQGIFTSLWQHPRCGEILDEKGKRWQKEKVGKTHKGKPQDQWFGGRSRSCTNPIPYPCMRGSMHFVVGDRVMFCVVVCPVFAASIPVVLKLILWCPAMMPPEAHIHSAVELSFWMGLLGWGNSCLLGFSSGKSSYRPW